MTTQIFAAGGYRFIPAVFQYSGGVAAEPGHRIVRVTFREHQPLKEGFAKIEKIIQAAGRPLTSFCACELRSPVPFDEAGFKAFNEVYVKTLERWGVYDGKGTNPVARSNVCPELAKPPEPGFYAFSYTEKADNAPASFVVAGSGESTEGGKSYRDSVVALGDHSDAGIRKKAVAVLGEMERRMKLLGFAWKDTTAVQLYTVFNVHPFLADEIVKRGAARNGLTWHFNRPPVDILDYEMDVRGVYDERVA
jgi:hypothetical protein